MKKDNYEAELPEGYELKYHIDAKNAKTTVIYTLLAVVPLVITLVAAYLLAEFVRGWGAEGEDATVIAVTYFVTLVIFIAYVVLHELVHGITYKILTGAKLTFGLTLTVAFCGVPEIYVYRRAAKLAVLMPFLVFTVIFGALTVGMYFVGSVGFMAAAFILGLHLGGCVGDLHVTYMLDHKFNDAKTLMRDTGPEQFFYVYTGKKQEETPTTAE